VEAVNTRLFVVVPGRAGERGRFSAEIATIAVVLHGLGDVQPLS
jgi:hypothetical protein